MIGIDIDEKEKGNSQWCHRCCRLLHSASCCCSWGNWCCCSGLTSVVVVAHRWKTERRGWARWSGCRLHLRVAWCVGLRVEKSVWYWNFIPSKLVSIGSHVDSFEGLGWDLHSFSFPDKSQPYSVGYIGFLILSYFDESSLLFLRIWESWPHSGHFVCCIGLKLCLLMWHSVREPVYRSRHEWGWWRLCRKSNQDLYGASGWYHLHTFSFSSLDVCWKMCIVIWIKKVVWVVMINNSSNFSFSTSLCAEVNSIGINIESSMILTTWGPNCENGTP